MQTRMVSFLLDAQTEANISVSQPTVSWLVTFVCVCVCVRYSKTTAGVSWA